MYVEAPRKIPFKTTGEFLAIQLIDLEIRRNRFHRKMLGKAVKRNHAHLRLCPELEAPSSTECSSVSVFSDEMTSTWRKFDFPYGIPLRQSFRFADGNGRPCYELPTQSWWYGCPYMLYVMYIYICMYVCMYACMYVCMPVCMYECIYIIYTYIYI